MSRYDWQANYYMSPQSIAVRARLRSLANTTATISGKDYDHILKVLVEANVRNRLAECPGAVKSATAFEMELHEHDQLTELVNLALEILRGD